MSTIEQPRAPQPLRGDQWWTHTPPMASAAWPQPPSTDDSWSDAQSDADPEAPSSAAVTFGAIRLVFLMLVAFVLIAPFAPLLVLLGVVGAILAVPYVLIRRRIADR